MQRGTITLRKFFVQSAPSVWASLGPLFKCQLIYIILKPYPKSKRKSLEWEIMCCLSIPSWIEFSIYFLPYFPHLAYFLSIPCLDIFLFFVFFFLFPAHPLHEIPYPSGKGQENTHITIELRIFHSMIFFLWGVVRENGKIVEKFNIRSSLCLQQNSYEKHPFNFILSDSK